MGGNTPNILIHFIGIKSGETKKNFSREKKRCDEFIKSIGATDLKNKLTKQIHEKCDYLLNYSDLKSVEFFKENNQQINNEVSSFQV